jgi:uncharacterized protein (TIGR03083 family)
VRLTPHYGADPILCIETSSTDVAAPLLRQRTRFADELSALDETEWRVSSRCDGWTVQDVVAHLTSVNQFWALSITAGLAGEPTRFLAEFDPVATPAQMVEAVRSWSAAETLERFLASNVALADAVAAIDGDSWLVLGEAPPGHVTLRALGMHALWDSWIHERDVLLPLGRDVIEEPDEIIASLQYAAALGPALLASTGSTRVGALRIEATDPDAVFTVDVGPVVVVRDAGGPDPSDATVLPGDAVHLLEFLSFRAPMPDAVDDSELWMTAGLAVAFDAAG